MLNIDQKKKVITKFKVHKDDTGSSAVQVALLTEKIKLLTKHLKKHGKDVHSRRGLLKMVQKRKDMLDYLKKTNEKEFEKISSQLGLKTSKKAASKKEKSKKA